MAESNNIKDSTNKKDDPSFSDTETETDSESESSADTQGTTRSEFYSKEVQVNLDVSDVFENGHIPRTAACNCQYQTCNCQYQQNNPSDSKLATQSVTSTEQQYNTDEHSKEPITYADLSAEAGGCTSSRPPGDLGKDGSIASEKDHVRQSPSSVPAITVGRVSKAPDPAPVQQDLHQKAKPKQGPKKLSGGKTPKRAETKLPKDAGSETSGAGRGAHPRDSLEETRHGAVMHQRHSPESDCQQSSESRSTAIVSAAADSTPAAIPHDTHGDVADASGSATSGVSSEVCDNSHAFLSPTTSPPSRSSKMTSPRAALLSASPLSLVSTPATTVPPITSLPVSTPSTMPVTRTTTPLVFPTTAATKATFTATTTTTTTSTTTTITTTTASSLTPTPTTRVFDAVMGLRLSPHVHVRAAAPRSQLDVTRRFQSHQLGPHVRLLRPTLIQEDHTRSSAESDTDLRNLPAWINAVDHHTPAHLRIILGASNFRYRTTNAGGNGNRRQGMTEGQRQTITIPSQELWYEVLQMSDNLPRRADGNLCEACHQRLAVMLIFNCHHALCEPCSRRGPANNYCLVCGQFITGLGPLR